MYFDTLHGRDLALAEHGLDEGEDALRCRGGRCHRKDIAKMMRAAFAHVGVHQCCCMCQQSGRLFFKLFSRFPVRNSR